MVENSYLRNIPADQVLNDVWLSVRVNEVYSLTVPGLVAVEIATRPQRTCWLQRVGKARRVVPVPAQMALEAKVSGKRKTKPAWQ